MKRINWTFYYKTIDNQIVVTGTGDFIKPDRSKLYAETNKFLGKDNVKGTGYTQTVLFNKEVKENNIF